MLLGEDDYMEDKDLLIDDRDIDTSDVDNLSEEEFAAIYYILFGDHEVKNND